MSICAARILIAADGRCCFPGIDYEGSKLTVHHRSKDLIVVKISGGSGWSGVGLPREYQPARFAIYNITGKPKKGKKFMDFEGEEIPIRQLVEFVIKRPQTVLQKRSARLPGWRKVRR